MYKFPKYIKIFTVPVILLLLVIALPQEALASSSWFQGIMWSMINATFGTAVGLAGLLLNYAVSDYVVGFGKIYSSTGLGVSINNLWAVIRDIFNLTFIFGLVFIGFKMIFGSDDSGAKKMLGSLVIAALLVNFSLFITKFVIDFSNIAAAQIAAAFATSSGGAAGAATYAVSDSFMNLMGLTGLMSFGGNLSEVAGAAGGWTYIFGTMFLYITAAFVFAAGGLLLMIRFVALNFYMVLSPLMFLGFVFPGLSGVSRDYWKGFMSKAFFAPAYLLMLYIANQVLVGMKGASGVAGFKDFFKSPAAMSNDFSAVIPYFILTIGFLVGSLIVAQKMGVEGANTAVALGKRASSKARQYAGGVTLGASAVAAQRSVGYGANRLANSKGLQSWAAKSKWGGETALKATRAVANSSFDARQVGGLGAATGLGSGKKGGYTSRIEEKNKADADFAKSLGKTDVTRNADGTYTDPDVQAKISSAMAATDAKLESARTQVHGANLDEKKAQEALDNADRNMLNEEGVAKLEADLANAKADVAKNKLELQQTEKSVEKELKRVETMVAYEKQLAFIDKREQQSKTLLSRIPNYAGAGGAMGALTGSGAVGMTTGMAGGIAVGTGLAVGGAGAVGASVVSSFGDQNRESAANLRKIYGTDGVVAESTKKRQEELKILSEQIKETTEKPPEPTPAAR
jgi:hypothetical protein